jgi:predicted PurR-regulated permease PerM
MAKPETRSQGKPQANIEPPYRKWRAAEMALVVLALVAIIGAAKVCEPFIVPVLGGVLLSYALEPLVAWFARVHVPRAIAAALVLAFVSAAVVGVGYLVREDAAVAVAELPQAARKIRLAARPNPSQAATPMEHVREAAAELNKAAAEAAGSTGTAPPPAATPSFASEMQHFVAEESSKVLIVFGQIGISLMLAFFLLASGDSFRRKLVSLAGPSLSARRVTVEVLDDIHAQVQRYLLIMLVTNVVIALLIWGALALLGVERAGLWGAIAGVLHFIPYAGTAIAVAATTLAVFLQASAIGPAVGAGFVVLLIGSLVGMGLQPWLQGRASQMNPVAVFVALLFFGWLWGGWGLLFGAPLVAILKTVADRVPAMKPLGELLGA